MSPRQLEPTRKVARLTSEQVLAIYHADLSRVSMRELAERFGVSKEAVRNVRKGISHKEVIAQADGCQLCTECVHWKASYCTMGFPDPELEGPAFARDCSLYEPSTQSMSRACPTSVQ